MLFPQLSNTGSPPAKPGAYPGWLQRRFDGGARARRGHESDETLRPVRPYQRKQHLRSPVREDAPAFRKGDLLRRAHSTVALTNGSTAPVLCTKSSLTWENGPPLKEFYSGMEYDSWEPAVTVNDYGKGKAIYICGDVGSGYDLNPLPQLRRFVASLLETATAPIEVDGPRVIELSATWCGGRKRSASTC